MICEQVEIKNICKIKSGKRLPKGVDFASGVTDYPYIRARDIKNGIIDGNDLVYLTEEVQKKIQKYIVNTNDIVITIVGASVGDVGFVKKEFDGFNLTENAVRLTDFDTRVNPRYLLYVLNSKKYWELMQQIAGGAAQPKLGIYKIESIPLEMPPIEVQNKIVHILSDFDDLIENNQKQIKLLEEASQRLYKEWFVDLCFPGHEDVAIVDGVPEGWTEDTIDSKIDLLSGYAFKSAEFNDEGTYKIVTIKNVKDGQFDGDNVSRMVDIPPKMLEHCKLSDGDILLSLTGNVGRVCIVHGDNYLLNQRVAKIKSDNPTYAYCLFRSKDMFDEMNNLANGAAQQNLSPIRTGKIKVVFPTDNLIGDFEEVVSPMMEKITMLNKTVLLLTQARDRLLPKLMSGEIEV